MKRYLLTGIFLFTFFNSFGQEKEIGFQGIIVDEQNIPIADVMVSVNWQKRGLLSKADGSFYIMANPQDTLVFKHTSFEPKAVALKNRNTTDTLKIQLTERTLILDEVQITNWGDWQDFKHKIATMNSDSIRKTDEYRLKTMFNNVELFPEDGYIERYLSSPHLPEIMQKQLNPFGVVAFGTSIGLNKKTPPRFSISEDRILKKKLEENEHRYNKRIIGKTLNIKGEELEIFKKYCDYFLDFSKNNYELTKQIKNLYETWKTQEINTIDSTKINYQPISKTPFNSSTSDKKE